MKGIDKVHSIISFYWKVLWFLLVNSIIIVAICWRLLCIIFIKTCNNFEVEIYPTIHFIDQQTQKGKVMY